MRTEPTQARGKAKVADIREAARVVLERVGRDLFTLEAVRQEAGVSIGTVYRYWADRMELLDEIQPVRRHGVTEVLALHRKQTLYSPPGNLDISFDDPSEAVEYDWFDDHEVDPDDGELAAQIARLRTFEVCAHCCALEGRWPNEHGEEWGIQLAIWPCATIRLLTGADS